MNLMNGFKVIDSQTGKEPDLTKIDIKRMNKMLFQYNPC